MFHQFWSNINRDIHFTSFLNQFLKSFSSKLKFHRPKTARCTRCSAPRGAARRDPWSIQAHASAGAEQGSSLTGRLSPPVSSLAVRSPPGAPRNEVDPMRQERALEELRRELDGAHGGAVARLVGGTPTPATVGHGEARTRFAGARRC